MPDTERIIKIRQARTPEELDHALDGYYEQIVANHPRLASNHPFAFALERKQYFHALCDIKRAAHGVNGGDYRLIIRVLEYAAENSFI